MIAKATAKKRTNSRRSQENDLNKLKRNRNKSTKPDLMTEQIFGKSVNTDLKDIIHNLSGNWIQLNQIFLVLCLVLKVYI